MADRVEGDRVVLDVRGVTVEIGVRDGLEQRRRHVLQVEDDHTGVDLRTCVGRELLLQIGLRREARHDRPQGGREAPKLVVRQRRAVRRDDDQVDDREHTRDDDEEREREPAADAPEGGHRSRNR